MPVEDHHFIKRLISYSHARLSTWGKILVAAAFLGAGAASPGTFISAYYLPSFIIALLLTAMIFSYFYRPVNVSARRLLPSSPSAGSVCTYTVLIKNLGSKPLRNLSVHEATLPYGIYAAMAHPLYRNTIDWLEANEEKKLTLAFRAPRRGVFELNDLFIGCSFPLGITRKPVRIKAAERFTVYPKFVPQTQLLLTEHRLFQPGGIAESSKVGDSNEFLSTREYKSGDRLRDVHWPSTARANKLIVKEYIEEYLVRIGIILDTHWPGATKPTDFEGRVSLCAGLASALIGRDCVVEVFTTDASIPPVAIGRSLGSLTQLLETLSCLEGDREVDLDRAFAQIRRQVGSYSSLLVIVKDWDARRAEFVGKLRSLGSQVRVFIVRRSRTTLPADETVTVIEPKKIDELIV